jgi:hypothetical protein
MYLSIWEDGGFAREMARYKKKSCIKSYKEWQTPERWEIKFTENYKRDRDLKWNDYQNIVKVWFEEVILYGDHKPKIRLKQKNMFRNK